MSFDPVRFRQDVLHLLDGIEAVFGPAVGAHALLRRQIALGDAIHDRRTFPGHVTTSAFILSRDGARVLLIRHRALGRWLQPGGHYEAPDAPADSALREAGEETGLSGLVLDPWHARFGLPIDVDTHWIPARPERGEPEHWHHDLRYVLRADETETLRPQFAEVEAAAWHPIAGLAAIAPAVAVRLEMIGPGTATP